MCSILIAENIPLKVNFYLLKDCRLEVYDLAQKGKLFEYPVNESLLSPPKGQSHLAFDGVLYLDTPSDKGAIFYFSTGFMEETEEGLLYKGENVGETLFKSGTKIILLDDNWIYFKGKFENIFESP